MGTKQVMSIDVAAIAQFERAVRRDGRFALEAFEFLHQGLELATRTKYGDRPTRRTPRHVSGQELCEALRVQALHRWGPLTQTVLREWNIRRTQDFGAMVYFMIGLGLLGRQDSDTIHDFDDVYDFDEAFGAYEFVFEAEDS